MDRSYKKLIVRVLEDIGDGSAPKYNKYSIAKECFDDILNYIKDKDFARGVCIVRSSKKNKVTIAGCMNPYLTTKGINYLDKNL